MHIKNRISLSTLVPLFVFFFFFTSDLNAQENIQEKGSVNFGFEAGLQFTNISDPYMPVSKAGTGYNAGPFIEYCLSNLVKFRAAIQYDNRAFKLESMSLVIDTTNYVGKTSYYDVHQNFKVNYLTIPISFIYSTGGEKFKFFLQGTVYYSFYINSVQTGVRDLYISEEDAPNFHFENHPDYNIPGHNYLEPEIQTFNSGDIGINALIGGVYYIKPGLGISLAPGFTFAFSNVWEDPSRVTTWSTLYKVTAGMVYSIK